ncbi:MAG TPA: tRNA pseudouridine(38-40) synthase TruA [Cyclobacteriaceae bacterium]|nr:tRNA pseudouridine(38-40) synthase TruA [Cyclobacteriaceae bacterium]
MRYFFHIGYNGSNYRGWQKLPQTSGENVQEIIELNLSKILKSSVSIVGCGRTDTGVHADQFFFHVDINKTWDYDLKFRMNKNLPDDIAVFDIIPVEDSRHARFDATERTYRYLIHTQKAPHITNTSAYYPGENPDVKLVERAVAMLTRYDDYSPFSKNIGPDRSTICKIKSASFDSNISGDRFTFQITANRFLNGMIRIIVHKLLLIGRHELSLQEFEQHLVSKKKPAINRLAHPQGLHLTKVVYPFLEIRSSSGGE